MPDADQARPRHFGKAGIWWLALCAVLLVLCMVLAFVGDTTELTPDHDDVNAWCFAVGALAAIVCTFIMRGATATWPTGNRIGFAVAASLGTFLLFSVALLFMAEIVEGRLDFPPSKTTTYPDALVQIASARQAHGKGVSWYIRTMPIPADIPISWTDYDFMRAHRSPADMQGDPDEIASDGYFCARVTLQRAGAAVRILHAGRWGLPQGSIMVCPADFGRRAHL
jgi:hypothetical protein